MSGGASASPARCENNTNAPSTDAWTVDGTTSRMTAANGPLYQVYRKYVARMSGANHLRSCTSKSAAQTGAPGTKPAPEMNTRPPLHRRCNPSPSLPLLSAPSTPPASAHTPNCAPTFATDSP